MSNPMTCAEFIECVSNERMPAFSRRGQHVFNRLQLFHPKLADECRGVYGLDPFHNDKHLPVFFAWLAHVWPDPPQT